MLFVVFFNSICGLEDPPVVTEGVNFLCHLNLGWWFFTAGLLWIESLLNLLAKTRLKKLICAHNFEYCADTSTTHSLVTDRWQQHGPLMVSTLIRGRTSASFDTPFTNDKANELLEERAEHWSQKGASVNQYWNQRHLPSPRLTLSFPSLSYSLVPGHLPHFLSELSRVISPQYLLGLGALLLSFAFKNKWMDRLYFSIILLLFTFEMQINLTTCGEY